MSRRITVFKFEIEYASAISAHGSTAFLLNWKQKNVDISKEHKADEKKVECELNAMLEGNISDDMLRKNFAFRGVGDKSTSVKYKGPDNVVIVPAEYNGKKVTEIGENAFKSNAAANEIIIPQGIVRIEEEAFRDCAAIKKLHCQIA